MEACDELQLTTWLRASIRNSLDDISILQQYGPAPPPPGSEEPTQATSPGSAQTLGKS